jgi:hypothetical protein
MPAAKINAMGVEGDALALKTPAIRSLAFSESTVLAPARKCLHGFCFLLLA